MAENDDVDTLSRVHGQLVDAVSRLDRAGHHAAVAHIVAAIELVETDAGFATSKQAEAMSESAVTLFARRMMQEFGDRAESVARGQLVGGVGPAMLAWAAIINRIAA